MSEITIYHNPNCGTSRNVLALLVDAGVQPIVIEYLKTPPDRAVLRDLLGKMGMSAKDILRQKGTPYFDLGLDAAHWSDEQLLAQIDAHPILLNRPIVVSQLGVRLCRPSDLAVELLPKRPAQDVFKEDGSPVLVDELVDSHTVNRAATSLATTLRDAQLDTRDLNERGRTFFEYRTLSAEVVGYAGFERYDEHALLRSIVVKPSARGRGVGASIVSLLLRRAFDAGARTAWLLTTTAAPFFESAGFSAAQRAAAPPSIIATRQASDLCPSDSALLTRMITL